MTDSAQSEVDNATSTLPSSISARLGRLQFHLSGKFRVLQCADVQDVAHISKDTISLISAACDAVRPDIVIFTGNQIAGYEKDFSRTFRRRNVQKENGSSEITYSINSKDKENLISQVKSHISRMVEPLEKRNIPWVVTYGNHDFQCGLSNSELDSLYQEYSCCMNKSAVHEESFGTVQCVNSILPKQLAVPCEPGTFALPVMDVQQERNVFALVLVDSGDYAIEGGYGSPSKKALNFLEKLPTLVNSPLCVFQHFPLPQYYDLMREVPKEFAAQEHAIEGYRKFSEHYYALDESKVLPDGYLGEGISCPDEDSGEFDILSNSETFAVIAGHDHRNAFAGKVNKDGILFVATATCGFGSYGPEPAKRGVRLLEFDIRHPFEPRTQMLEFGDLVGKSSSKKPYTYGLTAESEHELPEVDLLRKPSLLARIVHHWRNKSSRY